MAKARANRLSVDDWIQAGYAILAEEGIKSLKVDRLCSRLGVTKGSFYWHFTDIASYRIALVDAWGASRDEERRHFAAPTDTPPRERLSQMMSTLVDARHWTLERAMREWARTDEEVAASVRAADRRVLVAVRQAFLDYGFEARRGRPARKRNVRGRNRLPAPVRAAAQHSSSSAARTLPRHHADALTPHVRRNVPVAWAQGDRRMRQIAISAQSRRIEGAFDA